MIPLRLAFLCYLGVLFLSTHCPTSVAMVPEGDYWNHLLLLKIAELGDSRIFYKIDFIDKFIHILAYAVLTALAFIAAASHRLSRQLQKRLTWCSFAGIVMLLIGYGLFDEITQPLFGRSFEWPDYAANLLGILAVALIAAAIHFFFWPANPSAVGDGR